MAKRKIAIGCDHAAVELKGELAGWLAQNGFEVLDCGIQAGCRADYPVVAEKVCRRVAAGECEKGVLCCGTGIGMAMTANKIHGIRAAQCPDYYSAKYARLHNDANVACFGGRVMGAELAKELLNVFLATGFEGGRHRERVDLVMRLENEVHK